MATGANEFGGRWKDLFEAFDSAEGDDVEDLGDLLGPGGLDFNAGEVEGTDDLAKERGLLLVRLDEGDVKLRNPHLDGKAGEAGAGANVGQGGGWRHG